MEKKLSLRRTIFALLVSAILVVAYLKPIKSFRNYFLYSIVETTLISNSKYVSDVKFNNHNFKYSFSILSNKIESSYVKSPFGATTLFSLCILLFIGRYKHILFLLIIDLTVSVSAILMFRLALEGFIILFALSYLLTKYLIPLITLALPLYAIISTKNLPSNP